MVLEGQPPRICGLKWSDVKMKPWCLGALILLHAADMMTQQPLMMVLVNTQIAMETVGGQPR